MTARRDASPRPPSDEKPLVPAVAWTTAIVLAVAHLTAFTDRYLISLVAPALKASLAISDFQLGILQGSAFVLIFSVGALAIGPIADRRRRTYLIAASVVCWTAATLCCAFARSFEDMFAARLALGLGQAALSPAALSLIASAMPRHQLSRGVSIYTSGSTLGRSAALLGGGALLTVLGSAWPEGLFGLAEPWRALFVVAALPNLLLVVALLMLPERPRRVRAIDAPWRGWLARHVGDYLLMILAAAAATLIIQSVTAWTTTILMRRDGMSLPEAGAAFGAIVLVFAPAGHLTGGFLLDRLRPRFRSRTSHAVFAMSFLAALPTGMAFCIATGTTLSLAGLAGLTFALGLATPSGFSGIQAMTPRAMRARASGLFVCCITLIGFGLGPPLVGLLSDRVFGEANAHLSLATVLIAAACCGLAACALRFQAR